jgi:hypothetical protein
MLSHAVHPAPPGLAQAAGAAAASGTSVPATLIGAKGLVLVMASTKLKILAAAIALLVVCGGAAVAWKAVAPPASRTLVVAAGQQRTGGSPPSWQARFNQVYGLADGQLIKQVVPPMIPERQLYWDAQTNGRPWTLTPDSSFIFQWNGQSARWITISIVEGDLRMVLDYGLRIPDWQIDSSIAKDLKFPGDWVVRKDAPVDQAMTKLAGIVSQRLGKQVHFELRRVRREAIIVRGRYHFVPLAGQANDGVIRLVDGSGKMPRRLFIAPATFSELLEKVQACAKRRVYDQTTSSPATVQFGDPQYPQQSEKVIQNIAAQTSLHFDREPREMQVWTMVQGK